MARNTQNPMEAVADRMMRRLSGGVVPAAQRSASGVRGIGRLVARAEGSGLVGDPGRARLVDRLAERTEGDALGASLVGIARDLRRLRTPLAASAVSEDALVWLELAADNAEDEALDEAAPLPGEPILRTIQGWSSRPKPERKQGSRPVARAFGRVRRPSAAGGEVAAAAAVSTGKTRSRLLSAIDLLETLSPREAARMAEVLLASAPRPAWQGRAAAADGRVVPNGRGRRASAVRPSQAAAVRVAQASGRAVRAPRSAPARRSARAESTAAVRPSSGRSRASSDGPSGRTAGSSVAPPRAVTRGTLGADAIAARGSGLQVPELAWAMAAGVEPARAEGPLVRATDRMVGRRGVHGPAERGAVPSPSRSLVPRPVAVPVRARSLPVGLEADDDLTGAAAPTLDVGRGDVAAPVTSSDSGRSRASGRRGLATAAVTLGAPDTVGLVASALPAMAVAASRGDLEAEGSGADVRAPRDARDVMLAAAMPPTTRRTRLTTPEAVWLEATQADAGAVGEGDDDAAEAPGFGAATTRTVQGWSSRPAASPFGSRGSPVSSPDAARPTSKRAVLTAAPALRAARRGEWTGQVEVAVAAPRVAPRGGTVGPVPRVGSPMATLLADAEHPAVVAAGEAAATSSPPGEPSIVRGARGVEAALVRVAVPRRRGASTADTRLASLVEPADRTERAVAPLTRALAPAVAVPTAVTGIARALARTDAGAATLAATPTVSSAWTSGDAADGPAARLGAPDAQAPGASRPTRLAAPQPAWLTGAADPAADGPEPLPLGAPGEGRVVRTAPRAAREEVTVRLPSRAGRALHVAGRDGLDASTWMRWRSAAVRGDAPASVAVSGPGAAEVASQIARWERTRGVAGAMARPGGPLPAPVAARAPVDAGATPAPEAVGVEAGGRSVAPRARRPSAAWTAALRSEGRFGATLTASADGGAMAEAAIASASFTAAWSAGRREDGQPAGYAHRAVAADAAPRPLNTRPDLAYLAAAGADSSDAAPAFGESVTRTVRGGRRVATGAPSATVGADIATSEEVQAAGVETGRLGGRSPDAVSASRAGATRASPSLRGVGRAANALFTALARSTTAAEVATVLLEAPGAAAAELAEALPEPAARAVYEVTRMRTLPESEAAVLSPGPARQGGGAVAQSGASSAAGGATNLRAALSAGVRRVRRSGGGGGPTAVGHDGHGEGRLMKLSQKLLGLIHLAESQKTDATRQVRRSDEKVGAASQGRAGQVEGADGVTLASLQREVLEAVQRELERSRERGEGGRYGDFWW